MVYGLGGKDFYVEDAVYMLEWAREENGADFSYYGVAPGGQTESVQEEFFAPLTRERTDLGITTKTLNATTAVPKRLAPGHGACPGCGIPVNLNLLLRLMIGMRSMVLVSMVLMVPVTVTYLHVLRKC